MLLADLVSASDAISATSGRNDKQSILAAALSSMSPDEIEPGVGFLAGEPRQGKIGVGWSALSSVDVDLAFTPTLSITEVDAALTLIRDTTGPGSAARRADALAALFALATEPEAAFLRRLLVGELRQGALEGVAIEGIAKAAGVPAGAIRRALMLGGDLRMTARIALTEGLPGLERTRLTVMRPLQPMLASSAPTVTDALRVTGLASVEWKLDGVRIQVHRNGDDVKVFTRNLNDITGRVPEIAETIRSINIESFVADGEAIVLGENARPILFQETMSRVGRAAGERGVAMVPFLFDILHRDGEDLIDRPLRERIQTLEELSPSLRIPGIVTADAAEADAFLQTSLAAGHEGVMVKGLESTYQAGRRGKAWVKVKPAPTLDLVILAAEWGHGRRSGLLSNLHLGARDPNAGDFVMVGKTFKGLTDEMLRWQTQHLSELERDRDTYTVYVRPELVVEIAVDSAQVSTRYPGGVALRFARVKRYRTDKSSAEADTIDAVRALVPK